MNLEYLYDRKGNLIDLLREKKKELIEVNIKIKENQRFAEILEKENSTPFTEFTPQVVSSVDRKKQQDLYNEGNLLYEKKESLDNEINRLDNEIAGLNNAIEEINNSFRNLNDHYKKILSDSLDKLVEVQKFLVQDPVKASIEISLIIERLRNHN